MLAVDVDTGVDADVGALGVGVLGGVSGVLGGVLGGVSIIGGVIG